MFFGVWFTYLVKHKFLMVSAIFFDFFHILFESFSYVGGLGGEWWYCAEFWDVFDMKFFGIGQAQGRLVIVIIITAAD